MMPLDIAELEEHYYYDPSSPSCLRHKTSKMGGLKYTTLIIEKGAVAGSVRKGRAPYYAMMFRGKSYKCHHVILALHGHFRNSEEYVVDHVDGDSLNNRIENLRIVEKCTNARNIKKRANSYLTTGVYSDYKGNGLWYFTAAWYGEKKHQKSFSINKLGIMVAFRDAVVHRQKMIEQLNAQGAGYTDRHGKETK